jgi:hypothetical protein
MDIEDVLEDSPAAARPVSHYARTRYTHGEESSDEELLEYMSSNNKPSGPYAADFNSHYFGSNPHGV